MIVDDILVVGRGKTQEEAEVDHDRNMVHLMKRLREKNIKLNVKKMKFKVDKVDKVKYMGHQVTSAGLEVDPAKVESIVKMPPPKDVKELKTFLGMVNYHSKFIPNLAKLSEPLRILE